MSDDARPSVPAEAPPPPEPAVAGRPFDEKLRLLLRSPATLGLTLVNVAVFVVAEAVGDTTDTATLLQFGASERTRIWSGELWRLVTPMFLHIGVMHLLWNTWAGFGWSSLVEQALGWRRFLAVYLGTGIVATGVSVIGQDVVGAGASGAGFGIVGVRLVLMYRERGSLRAFLDDPQARRDLTGIGVWLFLGLGIIVMDGLAHVGGLVAGVVLGLLSTGPAVAGPRAWRRDVLALAGVVVVALLASRPLPGLHTEDRIGEAAKQAMDRGDYAEVLRLVDDPALPPSRRDGLLHLRGFAHLNLGHHAQARADADQLLRTFPSYAEAYRLRAEVRVAQGDHKGAVIDYTLALSLEPTNAWYLYGRARSQHALGDLKRARADLDAALQHQAELGEAYWVRADVRHSEGDFAGALADHDRAVQAFPGATAVLVNRAATLMAMNRHADAERDLRAALEKDARAPGALASLCYLRVQQQQLAEAQADCTRAIEQDATDVPSRVSRGNTYLRLNQLALALQDYEAVLALREDIDGLLGRGVVRLHQGALEGALADASHALAVQPDNADAHTLRADVLMAKGQRAAALASYREALARAAPGWSRAAAVQQRAASLARGR